MYGLLLLILCHCANAKRATEPISAGVVNIPHGESAIFKFFGRCNIEMYTYDDYTASFEVVGYTIINDTKFSTYVDTGTTSQYVNVTNYNNVDVFVNSLMYCEDAYAQMVASVVLFFIIFGFIGIVGVVILIDECYKRCCSSDDFNNAMNNMYREAIAHVYRIIGRPQYEAVTVQS